MGTSWITEVMEEMRFALQCYGSSKVIIDLPFSNRVSQIFMYPGTTKQLQEEKACCHLDKARAFN